MKKIELLFGLLIISIFSFAQNKQLLETTVTPPVFVGVEDYNYDENSSKIHQFVNSNIENTVLQNGVVVVLFTIEKNGSVSNIDVLNSVSHTNDNAVVTCIEKTSGFWNPGHVDGQPVAMEKEIHVNFTDPSMPSLEEMAIYNLERGLKQYQKVEFINHKFNLTQKQMDEKSSRKLEKAIRCLEMANKYQPQEPSIIFWQARVYEKAGYEMESLEKQNRFNEMVSSSYVASTEEIDISIK